LLQFRRFQRPLTPHRIITIAGTTIIITTHTEADGSRGRSAPPQLPRAVQAFLAAVHFAMAKQGAAGDVQHL